MADFIAIVPWLLTIFIMSFVFRENPLFRFAEHLALGATAGQVLLTGIEYITASGFTPIARGNVIFVLPVLLGIALFSVFSKGHVWVARYPSAILAGVGLGIAVRGMIKGQFIDQMIATITLPKAVNLVSLVYYFLGLFIVLTSMSHFIFTKEHKGLLGHSARIGRYFILAGLGVGYTGRFLSNATLLIDRLTYLVETFMKIFLGR